MLFAFGDDKIHLDSKPLIFGVATFGIVATSVSFICEKDSFMQTRFEKRYGRDSFMPKRRSDMSSTECLIMMNLRNFEINKTQNVQTAFVDSVQGDLRVLKLTKFALYVSCCIGFQSQASLRKVNQYEMRARAIQDMLGHPMYKDCMQVHEIMRLYDNKNVPMPSKLHREELGAFAQNLQNKSNYSGTVSRVERLLTGSQAMSKEQREALKIPAIQRWLKEK